MDIWFFVAASVPCDSVSVQLSLPEKPMSWKTTPEQNAIIEWQGNQLVVNAFAGTGKTTELVQFAQANLDSKMLYLTYSRAIRDEAE
jgi:hypothetical protein